MKNKKNFLFALIGAGTLVLSAGVGFAAWTINAQNVEENQNITVSADGTVNDNRISITSCTPQSGFNSIAFKAVKPNDSSITSPWLTTDSDATSESLTLKYDLKIKGVKGLTLNCSGSVKDTGTDDSKSQTGSFDQLKNEHIVGDPTVSADNFSQGETEDADSKVEYSTVISVTFSWGSHFERDGVAVNPYVYYNSLGYSDPRADDAKATIAKLNTIASYDKLQLHYSVSVNNK